MTKSANQLKKYFPDDMPTTQSWNEFVENHKDDCFAPSNYPIGTFHMVQAIENILKADDFETMKSQLTQLHKERLAFVDFTLDSPP